jgi:ADP-ribosylglycohydrolase
MTVSLSEHIMMGCALGDALGAPIEFLPKGDYQVMGMDAYSTVHESDTRSNTFMRPRGCWTDDTAMALCLAASLAEHPDPIDEDDMMDRFIRWVDEGYMSVTGYCDDIGITCHKAVLDYKKNHDERSNGNGSLMRIAPIIAFASALPDISDRRSIVEKTSALTHAHPLSLVGCLLFEEWAYQMIHHPATNGTSRKDWARNALRTAYQRLESLDGIDVDILQRYGPVLGERFTQESYDGSGFIVDSFLCAAQSVLSCTDFKTAILQSVTYGRDNDTIGAIAGTIGSLVYDDTYPEDWMKTLQGKDIIVDTARALDARISTL